MAYELEVYSVRDSVPRGRVGGFASVRDAQRHVRENFAGLSSYRMVIIYDGDGNEVMRGVRSSVRGGRENGKRFIWTETAQRHQPN